MIVRAWFDRKPERFAIPSESVVEKIVELSAVQFAAFLNAPLKDWTFIAENVTLMRHDGERDHCLLILEQGKDDGLLVQSEGYAYARYAAYLPSARIILNASLEQAAELIVKEGTEYTSGGNWRVTFDELYEKTGLVVNQDNGVGSMLLSVLERRPEIAEAELTDECFDAVFYLNYCKNLDASSRPEETAAQRQARITDRLIAFLAEHDGSEELYQTLHGELGLSHEEMESMGFDLAHRYECEPSLGINGPKL